MPDSDEPRGKGKGFKWISLTTVLVILNIIAFNIISQDHFKRWDFTEKKLYTLDSDTVNFLASLEDQVLLKVYVSENLPPVHKECWKQVEDVLDEFKLAAGDKLDIVYLNPTDDQSVQDEAENYGVLRSRMVAMTEGRREALHGYRGIVVLYEGHEETRHATLPLLENSVNLEFELLMKIAQAQRVSSVTIAFHEIPALSENLTDEARAAAEAKRRKKNKHEIASDLKALDELFLSKYYNVITLPLTKAVPDDVSTLVLANPHIIDELAIYFIDQFLMRGGKLIILKPGLRVNYSTLTLNADRGRLDAWLKHYGIEIDRNVVMDKRCIKRTYVERTRAGQMIPKEINSPPFILVDHKLSKNDDHPITAPLSNDILVYFCSSIKLAPPDPQVAKATTLFRSSGRSWCQDETNLDINPDRIFENDPGKGSYSAYDLAGLIEGRFTSFFTAQRISDSLRQAIDRSKKRSGGATAVRMSPVAPGMTPGDLQKNKDKAEEKASPPEEEEKKPVSHEKQEDPAGEEAAAAEEEKGLNHPDDILLQSEETAILVVGCNDFIAHPVLIGQIQKYEKQTTAEVFGAGWGGSLQFFASAVDYLALGGGFSNIRAREVYLRHIEDDYKEPGTKSLLLYTGTLSGAALVVVIGLLLSFLRRSAQRKEVTL